MLTSFYNYTNESVTHPFKVSYGLVQTMTYKVLLDQESHKGFKEHNKIYNKMDN